MMNRRKFLGTSSLASASLFIPAFLQSAIQSHAFAQSSGKRLIVIQLAGGNDGLNTIVPFQNDLYYQNRPKISLKAEEILKINDETAFHASLKSLLPWFNDGKISIINNVGYPNPDRSHFRSGDIWHSASNSDEYWQSGWIGRYLDIQYKLGKKKPWSAIECDDTLSLADKGELTKAVAMRNPVKFVQIADAFSNMQKPTNAAENENLNYLYNTLAETQNTAKYLHGLTQVYQSKQIYPAGAFGADLKMIAELIGSGCDTSVYFVSLSGFDTHANQKGLQSKKLKVFSEALSVFLQDLKGLGQLDDSLILVFSEFGRRVKENAAGGTDHGTANQVFLMGSKLKKPGIFNEMPDLNLLDSGDLIYKIDFRNIYSDILTNWLQADSQAVLKRKFDTLGLIKS